MTCDSPTLCKKNHLIAKIGYNCTEFLIIFSFSLLDLIYNDQSHNLSQVNAQRGSCCGYTIYAPVPRSPSLFMYVAG